MQNLYTFNKLPGPRTSLFLLCCFVAVITYNTTTICRNWQRNHKKKKEKGYWQKSLKKKPQRLVRLGSFPPPSPKQHKNILV